jgi:membrane protease YdiL (CAAX protease family)
MGNGTELRTEAAQAEPTWTYHDVAVVTAFAVVAQVLVYVLGALVAVTLAETGVGKLPTAGLMRRAWFLLPMQAAWWGLVFWLVYRVVRARDRRPFREAVGWVWPPRPIAAYLAGGILLAMSVAALSWLLPMPRGKMPIEQLLMDPASAFLMAGFGVLIAPAVEELLFRGFLYPVMERAHGAEVAVLATALLFGAVHAPQFGWAWQNVLLLAYVGVVFGVVRRVSGSLVPSTLVHAAYNLTLFAGLWVSTNRFQDL